VSDPDPDPDPTAGPDEPRDEPRDEPGEPRVVGVGPWPGEWPDDERYDPQLLAEGDRRNVADAFRYLRHEAVVAELDARRHPLHVAVENHQHDANIGSVVRTANAVNAAGVHVVGRRRWNRRGAMVTDRYLSVHHHPDVAALAAWAAERDLPLVGVDNVEGSLPLETYDLPRACVMIFGQEGPGLSDEAVAACTAVLAIAQFGSTRSLNVGAAAAIAQHAWVRRHVFGQVPGSSVAEAPSGPSGGMVDHGPS